MPGAEEEALKIIEELAPKPNSLESLVDIQVEDFARPQKCFMR